MACHRSWIWDMPRGPLELPIVRQLPSRLHLVVNCAGLIGAPGARNATRPTPPKTGLHWPG
eukprot:3109651-Pyramimonas_sp.AAC.1